MEITRTSSKQFSTIDDGKIIKSKIDIIKETKDYIHLYTDFNSVPMAFVRVLDKNKKTFVMVGLEYQNSTSIIEGNCIVR